MDAVAKQELIDLLERCPGNNDVLLAAIDAGQIEGVAIGGDGPGGLYHHTYRNETSNGEALGEDIIDYYNLSEKFTPLESMVVSVRSGETAETSPVLAEIKAAILEWQKAQVPF